MLSISFYENKDSIQNLGFPLRELPELKTQRRKRQAKNSMPEWKICGADTETIDGKVWLFSTEFGVWEIETFRDLINIMFDKNHAKKWRKSKATKGGIKRGLSSKEYFFWNLKFDVQAIMKLFSDEVIDKLLEDSKDKIIINADTGDFGPEIPGSMVQLDYLEGKSFQIKPIKWKIGIYELGMIYWWDISQFYYRVRLQTAAERYLGESKIEKCFDGSVLDASKFNDKEYRDYYREDIDNYAVVDAELAGKLARKCRADFISQGVRFIRPYSMANIAQRALLDTCDIPTINEFAKSDWETLRMQKALSAFKGGWFETRGSGFYPNCQGLDLASAYPYIMYFLQNPNKGAWIEGDIESEWWEWIEKREPYTMGFAEATILFKPGLKWYPLVQKAASGTLVAPRLVRGWFTADELTEARKWPHTQIIIGEWFYHFDENPEYPFRKFIDKFYKIKMEATDDPIAYRVSKIALNSIYGKTIQAVNDVAGKLWNPFFASTITGATRARLAELNRLNNYSAVSFATDGIIFPAHEIVKIPNRPKEAPYNLGQWELEESGNVLILMSGVYSFESGEKVKTTFRGSASYFIRNYRNGGLFRFCEEHSNRYLMEKIITKPYSAKEARAKSNYSLINIFEPRKFVISAMGDSNKRIWTKEHPQTFGDLTNTWWDSFPHSEVFVSGLRGVDDDGEDFLYDG